MKISKNEQAKKYIIFYIIIAIIFVAIIGIMLNNQNQKYSEQINTQIALIIGVVKKEYPDFDDEKIIQILDSKENINQGKEILKKYGISDDVIPILELQNKQTTNFYFNISIIIIAFLIFIIIFIIYLRNRQIKINRLDNYLEKVSQGDYSINIEESSEDELNELKNSIYKIAVMLREEAENKNKQNEAILDAVSDISHQLKTPLTSIQILLDNILESKDMDEHTRQKFIMEIVRQIKGMNFLILALLKLSKLEAGIVEFQNEKINMNGLIREVISNLEVLSEVKQIKLQLELQQDVNIYRRLQLEQRSNTKYCKKCYRT